MKRTAPLSIVQVSKLDANLKRVAFLLNASPVVKHHPGRLKIRLLSQGILMNVLEFTLSLQAVWSRLPIKKQLNDGSVVW